MTSAKNRVGSRLGTQFRGRLAAAYDARGHHQSDLVFAYSPRMEEDVILHSGLEYGHFLLVESDPSIRHTDYSPKARMVELAGTEVASLVDAEVVNRDGVVSWREVKYKNSLRNDDNQRLQLQTVIHRGAPHQWAANHQVFTEIEIYENPVRIRNWNRIVAWMAQARDFPLITERKKLLTIFGAKRSLNLADILALGDRSTAPLFAAAAFKLVQAATLDSDLDQAPLSLHSVFSRGER